LKADEPDEDYSSTQTTTTSGRHILCSVDELCDYFEDTDSCFTVLELPIFASPSLDLWISMVSDTLRAKAATYTWRNPTFNIQELLKSVDLTEQYHEVWHVGVSGGSSTAPHHDSHGTCSTLTSPAEGVKFITVIQIRDMAEKSVKQILSDHEQIAKLSDEGQYGEMKDIADVRTYLLAPGETMYVVSSIFCSCC
jgi:hypothetical protein